MAHGHGVRAIARHAHADRKTVRRYIETAQAAGLSQGDEHDVLGDELVREVFDAVRPGRPTGGHGRASELMSVHREFLAGKLENGLINEMLDEM